MPRFSMNELTTYRWSFDEDVHHYKEAGYKAIGIWRRKLTDFGIERGIELLEDSELAVTTLYYAGGFTGSDGRSLSESTNDAIEALQMAAAVKAASLLIYTGGRNHHTTRHAERLLKTAIEELLPLAEVLEVPLALKLKRSACAKDWSFLTSLEAGLELAAYYQSPYFKLVYDTYQFPIGTVPVEQLTELIPHLGLVQVADSRRDPSSDQEQCLLGRGDLKVSNAIGTLLEAGYEGDFDIKLTGSAIESTDNQLLLSRSYRKMEQYLWSPVRV